MAAESKDMMRLGAICRADNTGLGMQTWEFYRHMKPDKTLVVDISALNGTRQFPDRYTEGEVMRSDGIPGGRIIDAFLEGLDVVFVAESAYNNYFYHAAKERGVKVAVQYNYEFFDWFARPHLPMPDMLIAPSKWHYDMVQDFAGSHGIWHLYLHCPVNRDVLPPRKITKAKNFLHVAGRPAAHDRNGTFALIAASKLVKADVKIHIHFQGDQGLQHQLTDTVQNYIDFANKHGDMSKLVIRVEELPNYTDVYNDMDVLVLPRRYGGNCLPMNEALSCGMPVIMPNISPNNKFLPNEWLVSASPDMQFTPRTTIDVYYVGYQELADKIDEFAGLSGSRMLFESMQADGLAQKISWKGMEPKYRKAFERLCLKKP